LITTITFDFWQTLYISKPINYNERLQHLKADMEDGSGLVIEPTRFEAAVQVARDTWDRTWVEAQRTITADEWLSIVLNELDMSLKPAHFLKIQTGMENSVLSNTPTLVPEARTVLAKLSRQYRLGIISDTGLTPGRVLRKILAADQLLDYFTHLTFSDEVGRSKPHPDAFLTTLDALEAAPREAVHVGDLLRTDIAGAKGVGMRGVQYTGVNQDNHNNVSVTPDAVINSHTELEPLLEQWSASS
jgi:putative hydrolase of the HAD superfamily